MNTRHKVRPRITRTAPSNVLTPDYGKTLREVVADAGSKPAQGVRPSDNPEPTPMSDREIELRDLLVKATRKNRKLVERLNVLNARIMRIRTAFEVLGASLVPAESTLPAKPRRF